MICKLFRLFFRPLRCPTGVTLLELLAVIGLMSLLFAFSLPALGSFVKSSQHKKAARDIVIAIRLARSLATTSGLEHRVEIDMSGRRFRLAHGDRYSGSAVNSYDQNIVLDWQSLPLSVSLRANTDCSVDSGSIFFHANPNGTANTRYLCILDEHETFQFRVGIPYARTGKVNIHRWASGIQPWI